MPQPTADFSAWVRARMDAALALAEQGFAIAESYGVSEDGRCLCPNSACEKPGKHGGKGWKDNATRDPETIRIRFATGDPSYMVIPQAGSRLLIVDEDVPGALEQLGDLPDTFIVKTSEKPGGGRGRHLYGKLPPGIDESEIPNQWAGGEIRVAGKGGIVGPHCPHASGATYDPANGLTVAVLPEPWLRSLIASGHKNAHEPRASREYGPGGWHIPKGSRHTWLTSMAGKLHHMGLGGEPLRQALRHLNAQRCIPPSSPEEVDDIALWADSQEEGAGAGGNSVASEVGTLQERYGLRLLSTVSTEPPLPLLLGRLDPDGHTVLFGPGGVGKGVLTAWWIVCLVREGQRVLILDYEGHEREWSARIRSLGGPEAAESVHYVAPLTPSWTQGKGPIWVQAPALRTIVDQTDATYVVVDSIVPACAGMDSLKSETASQYASALQYLGLPTLSLAHVTKGDDLRYPFGSVFFHNLARTTWSLSSASGKSNHPVLQHRKHNNYPYGGAFQVEVRWREELPVEVRERAHHPTLADRISSVLAGGPLTVTELLEALKRETGEGSREDKPNTVRTALRRGREEKPPRFVTVGAHPVRWARA